MIHVTQNPRPKSPAPKQVATFMTALTAAGVLLWVMAAVEAAAQASGDSNAVRSLWAMPRWSPYAAGIGIGVLSWLVFLLSDNTLGASGAYAKSAGLIEEKLRGPQVAQRAYYQDNPPQIDWGWMLLAGIVLGAFLSAQLSGDFRISMVPEFWRQQMGSGILVRWPTALAGGVLLGVGSRWADGCTSGHGISGTLQMVVSSWVAVICFFIGGVVIALLIV